MTEIVLNDTRARFLTSAPQESHNLVSSQNDTSQNTQETCHIKCQGLLKNDTSYHLIFSGNGLNTIFKVPSNVGATGPYA